MKIKLFCIPFAGGSASIYYKWRKYFEDRIEIYPIELAGRGTRFNEKAFTNIPDIVSDIYNSIKHEINEGPYMIFGHSMGALISYELIHMIIKNGHSEPIHAFFSGKGAPHLKGFKDKVHKLSDDEFIKEVYSLGGTPKELLEEKEILKIFLGILRADYEAIETYKYFNRSEKFRFSITVFNGIEDKLTQDNITQWSCHTQKKCDIYNFHGGHFFINDNIKEMREIIESRALDYLDN